MDSIFKDSMKHSEFTWTSLGDVKEGRGSLGEEMPVLVYRLMQYTLLDAMTQDMGEDQANVYFRKAGHLAGEHLAKNMLDLDAEFDAFVADLQQTLKDLKIGILRMEAFDTETGNLVLTVGEDLDCSGIPVTDETVCVYDEGFIAGILEAYTGKTYEVLEVDCWATGDRVCRFTGTVVN